MERCDRFDPRRFLLQLAGSLAALGRMRHKRLAWGLRRRQASSGNALQLATAPAVSPASDAFAPINGAAVLNNLFGLGGAAPAAPAATPVTAATAAKAAKATA
jgi:hypothetical protein